MIAIKVLVLLLVLITLPRGGTTSSASKDAVNSSGDKTQTSESKKDVLGAPSNLHPQYMMPPNGHYQNGMMPGQIPQYLLQGSHQPPMENTNQNSLSDLKSEISTLKDTVLLLSSVVKQSAKSQSDQESQSRNYQQGHYQGGSEYHRDDDISIDVYQSNKNPGGYQPHPHPQSVQKKVIKEPHKPTSHSAVSSSSSSSTTTIIDDKTTNVKRTINLLPGSTSVTQAERTFAVIKRGIKNAVVTGVIVILVKLIPLLWAGLRLIFNAILPLVGMSLLNKNGLGAGQITKTITTAFSGTPASDTTPAPPSILLSNDVLDEELANLEDSFDIFKGKLY